MNFVDFSLRLGLAMLLGLAVGLEREWRQKSAGLRTNTLVSLGSCAFILMSYSIFGDTTATGRLASYVISGIGFLGAGVIMKDGLTVRGLNTAATLWCSAAVGSLSAIGMEIHACILSAAIMLTHTLLRPISFFIYEQTFKHQKLTKVEYLIKIKCKESVENRLRILLMQSIADYDKIILKSLSSDDYEDDPHFVLITAEVMAVSQQDNLLEKMSSRLTIEQNVQKVSWEILSPGIDNEA